MMLAGRPNGALRPWVEYVWYSEGALDEYRERVLPACTGDLVLNLGPDIRVGEAVVPVMSVTGLVTSPFVLDHPPVHRALGVQLTPLAMHALLGVPTGELNDEIADLASVIGADARDLAERCADAASGADSIRSLLDWLEARRRGAGVIPDPIATWAADEIVRRRGALDIASLRDRSGYGATRFIERFRAELGVTPKAFARLARFRAALDALGAGGTQAEVAAELGFADQAHMGAEFRRLAGRTPGQVVAALYPSGVTMADPAA